MKNSHTPWDMSPDLSGRPEAKAGRTRQESCPTVETKWDMSPDLSNPRNDGRGDKTGVMFHGVKLNWNTYLGANR
jgi:hypothetical protein